MSADSRSSSASPARYRSVLRPGLFAGEVHWVTGGGSGIGRCVAHELAALGATVVVSGRTPEKLTRVAAEIAEDGGRAVTCAFDIRDEDAVKAAVAAVVAEHGRVHGLVNNAGGQFPALLHRLGLEAEVSSAICFLLSEGAAFITGVTLAIDGGAPLWTPLLPDAGERRSEPYAGFHRATVPAVLKDADADPAREDDR